jgi:predicted transcriptional regulator
MTECVLCFELQGDRDLLSCPCCRICSRCADEYYQAPELLKCRCEKPVDIITFLSVFEGNQEQHDVLLDDLHLFIKQLGRTKGRILNYIKKTKDFLKKITEKTEISIKHHMCYLPPEIIQERLDLLIEEFKDKAGIPTVYINKQAQLDIDRLDSLIQLFCRVRDLQWSAKTLEPLMMTEREFMKNLKFPKIKNYDIFFYHEIWPANIDQIGFVDLIYDGKNGTHFYENMSGQNITRYRECKPTGRSQTWKDPDVKNRYWEEIFSDSLENGIYSYEDFGGESDGDGFRTNTAWPRYMKYKYPEMEFISDKVYCAYDF